MLIIATILAFARVSGSSPALAPPEPPRRASAAAAAPSDLAILVRSSDIDLGEVSAIDAAAIQMRALSLVVRSPGRWRLTVRSDSDFRGTSTHAVPAERLKLRVTGGPFLAVPLPDRDARRRQGDLSRRGSRRPRPSPRRRMGRSAGRVFGSPPPTLLPEP